MAMGSIAKSLFLLIAISPDNIESLLWFAIAMCILQDHLLLLHVIAALFSNPR